MGDYYDKNIIIKKKEEKERKKVDSNINFIIYLLFQSF
jgi:hypothetical protein